MLIDYLLIAYWLLLGCTLVAYWLLIDCTLVAYWLLIDCLLATYWLQLVSYWLLAWVAYCFLIDCLLIAYWLFIDCLLVVYWLQLQGGQNFFEKIRTKIRTFSEEIRTIRSIFEKKSVQSVQFSEKNLYNPCIKKKCVHFLKIRTISTIFEKNPCNPYI